MEPTSPSLAPSSGATLPTASRNFSLACSSDSGKSEEERDEIPLSPYVESGGEHWTQFGIPVVGDWNEMSRHAGVYVHLAVSHVSN